MEKPSESLACCPVHPKEEIRFYCNNCKTVICDDCVIGDHNTHVKVKLKDYGEQQRKILKSSADEARDMELPKIQKSIEKAEMTKKLVNDSIDKNITEIRINRESIKKIFDELQEELIKSFEEARNAANEHFNEIISCQTTRYDKLNEVINWIHTNHLTTSSFQIVGQGTELVKSFTNEPIPEVSKLKPPQYKFREEYIKKENLQYLLGQIDYGDYEPVPHTDVQLSETTTGKQANEEDECGSDFYEAKPQNEVQEHDVKYEVIKVYQGSLKDICHIIPKKIPNEAWVIGQGIAELNFKSIPATISQLISSLGGTKTVAGRSKTHGLVIGINGKKSMYELQFTTGMFLKSIWKLRPYGNIDTDYVKAMCVPRGTLGDLLICLNDQRSSDSLFHKENNFVLRWLNEEGSSVKEIKISPENVDIKNPIHICENNNGDICITCTPANEISWIVLIDKYGKQKMRYPPKISRGSESKTKLYSFIGANFLNNGLITILDRIQFRQHLISANGELKQIDHYDIEPTSMAMDEYDNIWVGFVDGKVKIMNYNSRYEAIGT